MTDAPVADPATRLVELAELVRYHNHRYHALDDPEISDGDFDALVRELRQLEADHPDVEFDDPLTGDGRRRAERPVRPGRARRADDEPRQRDGAERARRRGAQRVARGLARRDRHLRLRAEDRRAGDEPALRGRPLRARRRPVATAASARTSPPTSPRSPSSRSASPGRPCPTCSRCAARCTCRSPASSGSTSRPRPRAARSFVEPAQRGRRQPAPEGRRDHRQPRPLVLVRTSSARWSAAPSSRTHHETLECLRGARLPGQPGDPRCSTTLDEVARALPALGAAPPRPRLRDRRRGGEGRRPRPARASSGSRRGRRAGRSPTSSRPRSAPRCCATSRCRSGAPVGPRRSPCSSRCSSAARRSAWPRCTTRTRSRAKDVRPGDTVIVRKAGDVIPEVVGPVLVAAPEGRRAVDVPDRLPGVRQPRWCASRARPTPAASTPACPCQRDAADHLLRRRAGRWTSRASASAPSPSSATPASSPTPPTSTPSPWSSCSGSRASPRSAPRSCSRRSTGRSTGRCRGCSPRSGIKPPRAGRVAGAGARGSARSTRSWTAPADELAAVDGVGGVIAAAIATLVRSARQPSARRQAARRRRRLRPVAGARAAR